MTVYSGIDGPGAFSGNRIMILIRELPVHLILQNIFSQFPNQPLSPHSGPHLTRVLRAFYRLTLTCLHQVFLAVQQLHHVCNLLHSSSKVLHTFHNSGFCQSALGHDLYLIQSSSFTSLKSSRFRLPLQLTANYTPLIFHLFPLTCMNDTINVDRV